MDDFIPPSRSVLIAGLSDAKKRRLWGWIRENDPQTAAWLKSEDVTVLADRFPGSSPVLDIDYVREATA